MPRVRLEVEGLERSPGAFFSVSSVFFSFSAAAGSGPLLSFRLRQLHRLLGPLDRTLEGGRGRLGGVGGGGVREGQCPWDRTSSHHPVRPVRTPRRPRPDPSRAP